MSRFFNWALEASFVISTLLLLKLWVFPFFIHLWFQGVEPIPEWTMLIFAVVSCVIYIGLGSSAKYIYGLPWIGALFGVIALHVPLFFSKEALAVWQGLLFDGLSLFLPKQTLSSLLLSSIYLGFFLLGRGVFVKEKEQRMFREKRFMQLKR